MASTKLHLPPSTSTVQVSAINTTLMGNVQFGLMLEPELCETLHGLPSLCFLIQHGKDKIIFDLGVRKDMENFSSAVKAFLEMLNWDIKVTLDVADVLRDGGIALNDIQAVVWSHHHFDHIGNMKTFPPSTDLIVGEGFKNAYAPGYPKDPDSSLTEDAWEGRNFVELNFDTSSVHYMVIAGLNALDFFGDGSMYFVDAPGHTIGHVTCLCRTTQDTFIALGGDIAHHCSCLRPSEGVPLPDTIVPSPHALPGTREYWSPCACAEFVEMHPKQIRNQPFSNHKDVPGGMGAPNYDRAVAMRTRDKFQVLDGFENVFATISHDASLLPVIPMFPKTLNDWKEKGWKDEARWGFLRDFL